MSVSMPYEPRCYLLSGVANGAMVLEDSLFDDLAVRIHREIIPAQGRRQFSA